MVMIEVIAIETTDKWTWDKNISKLLERFTLSKIYDDTTFREKYHLCVLMQDEGNFQLLKDDVAFLNRNNSKKIILCKDAEELFDVYDNIHKYNTAEDLGLF